MRHFGSRRRARLLGLAALFAPTGVCLLPCLLPTSAFAQYQAPSEKLQLTARAASTWTEGDTDILQLEGPVTIELETGTLTAKQAVVWLTPEAGKEAGRQQVQVVLIGDGKVVQKQAIRSGERMLVNAAVAGHIRLTAEDRSEKNLHESALYQLADKIRHPQDGPQAVPAPGGEATAPSVPTTRFSPGASRPSSGDTGPATFPSPATSQSPATSRATRPTSGPATSQASTSQPSTAPTLTETGVIPPSTTPLLFAAKEFELVDAGDGTVAAILSGGVKLISHRPNGDLLELQGQRVVLFTPLKNLREVQQRGNQIKEIQDAVTAAYIEGDARIVFTPVNQQVVGEQRLEAARVYYEFTTDRAILTDAVLHAVDPKSATPIVVHARTIRQLARGEYETGKAELSTSLFSVPTYSIRANKIYVRQEPEVAAQEPQTYFQADNTFFRAFGIPFFWLPRISGDMSNNQTAFRNIGFDHSSVFGTGFESQWGLFETLGLQHPRDLDAAYHVDYYSDRGPAGGLDAKYEGGSVTDNAHQPWSFDGEFRSYFVYDKGTDDFGRYIAPRTEDDYRLRGQVEWEHQQFFPDDWQAQLRGGWVSDQTFLEQWFPRQFDRELPHDVSIYLKHQRDTEAFTLLVQFQPNDIVTTSDLYQEQFEVEHVPEIGYHRIGDSVINDVGTFYSDNSVSGLHFQKTRYSLAEEGFYAPNALPGIPSLGTTGVTNDTIWRGDFRQEIDFPFSAGPFRVVPYVMGRYTVYSDSPSEGTINRVYGGVGARVTTAFWKVDDTAQSELFDIHRIRHVIEPELNVFTSATTRDRSDVYIFDEAVDPVNDVSAVQLALRQRWQTYRGGPGRWRSVDFLTVNVEANLFSNQPDELQRQPADFRGLFFPDAPEVSVPRNSINFDATWRIADTTALLMDAEWNIDKRRLATASIGIVAQRDERTSYYLGTRYIDDLNSNITTVAADYEIDSKYNVAVAQSFDFSQAQNVVSSISVIRKFDTVFLIVKAFHDETTNQSGFGFSLVPRGLSAGVDTDTLSTALEARRK